MDKIDLAYVAGFFDGDGCVCISKTKPQSSHRQVNPEYKVAVSIANLYVPVLGELQQMFEGHLKKGITPIKSNHSRVYQWEVESRKAISFLNLVVPFLKIKKEQVQLALSFQEYKDSIVLRRRKGREGRGSFPYTLEEMTMFEQFRLALKELKGYASK